MILKVACGVCGESHEAIEVKGLTKRQGAATHWYHCPVEDEPVLMTIVQGAEGIDDEFLKSLREAASCGSYMVAAWWFRDGVPVMSRTTKEFPTNRFAASVLELQRNLQDEHSDSFVQGAIEPQTVKPHSKINLFN